MKLATGTVATIHSIESIGKNRPLVLQDWLKPSLSKSDQVSQRVQPTKSERAEIVMPVELHRRVRVEVGWTTTQNRGPTLPTTPPCWGYHGVIVESQGIDREVG